MELLMKAVNKITNVTKLRKDQLLIMVLAGILLCVIALPVKKKQFFFSRSVQYSGQ